VETFEAEPVTARDDIFSNIRRSLGVRGTEAPRKAIVEERLRSTPAGIIPKRGQLDGDGQLTLFKIQAESTQATVAAVATPFDVPAEIARYLRDNNLPTTVRTGLDDRLTGLPWQKTALEVTTGRSMGQDLNAVSHAFGAVAETGTLVVVSGAANPTSLNFLPDNHVVVVNSGDIVGDYETIWRRLREHYGKGRLPRTVNLISGPSRSADIEQTIFLGAHGPRRLHIIVAGEGAAPFA
jgi:L-lactate dehydrogenase complex protein LldG